MGKKKPQAKNKPTARAHYADHPPTIAADEVKFERWLRIVAPLIIAVTAGLLYAQVVNFGFVTFDDKQIIHDRFYIIGDISKIDMAFTTNAFLNPQGVFYRPLQTVTFMVDALISGRSEWMYHLSNVLLHLLTCVSLYWFLTTLYVKRLYAFFAGLLYAVHPLFVSTVAWVPARGDELLTLFSVLGFIGFIRYARGGNALFLVLHAVSYLFALFSKETAIGLPILCFAYQYLERRELKISKQLIHAAILWIPATAVWIYLRSIPIAVPQGSGMFGIGAFMKNLPMLPEMFGKFFLPVKLSLIPQFKSFDTLIGVVAVVVFLVLAYRRGIVMRTRFLFGAIWFTIFLVPVMLFRNVDADYIFEYLYHRAYITHIGLLLCIAELLPREWISIRNRYSVVAASAMLLFCGVTAYSLTKYYSEPIDFYTEAIVRDPQNALPYNNRASVHGNAKRLKEALVDLDKALDLFPNYVTALNNRAFVKGELYDYKSAVEDLTRSVAINPSTVETYFFRGNLRYLMKDFAGAISDYDFVLRSDKFYPRIYSKRAGSYAMLGKGEEAIRDANEALRIDPDDNEAYNNRGLAHRVLGKLDAAVADFNMSIKKQPDYSRPFNNRGVIWFTQGKFAEAIVDFDTAIKHDARYADAYSNRAMSWRGLGKLPQAMADIDKAIALNPAYPEALQNRGVLKNMLRRFGEAVIDFDKAIQIAPNFMEAYFGRGISKHYLNDKPGACNDWQRAAAAGSREAAALVAQNCR